MSKETTDRSTEPKSSTQKMLRNKLVLLHSGYPMLKAGRKKEGRRGGRERKEGGEGEG